MGKVKDFFKSVIIVVIGFGVPVSYHTKKYDNDNNINLVNK
jgi:hypothetical protein